MLNTKFIFCIHFFSICRDFLMQSTEAIEQTIGYDLSKVQIIQELIATETNYNQALSLLDAAFSKDELTQADKLCAQFKLIIPQLQVISDKLIANIRRGVDEELNFDERVNNGIARMQLIKAFCVAYQTYPKLYNEYTAEWKSGNAQFKYLDTSIRQATAQKFGLDTLLSQPFQRGMRYLLLVNEALKSNKDLPEKYIQELKNLKIILEESIALSNACMPAVKKPEPVSTSRFSIFGRSNSVTNNNTPPVSENNQQGYSVGNISRYLANKDWYKEESPVSELIVVEECSGEHEVLDGPPTDMPPELPPQTPELLLSLGLPPTDLPPDLPPNLSIELNFGHEEQILDEDGEDFDFDSLDKKFSI